jgi:hypothetical protein
MLTDYEQRQDDLGPRWEETSDGRVIISKRGVLGIPDAYMAQTEALFDAAATSPSRFKVLSGPALRAWVDAPETPKEKAERKAERARHAPIDAYHDAVARKDWKTVNAMNDARAKQLIEQWSENTLNSVTELKPEAPKPEPTPEQPKPGKFAIIEAADFANRISEPDWLIEEVLPAHGVGMIYGASGSHKTTAILDMLTAFHRGVQWRDKTVKRGRGVLVVAEGAYHFPLHMKALAKHLQIDVAELPAVFPSPVNLLDSKDVAEFTHELLKRGAACVVFDTKQQCSPGADENAVKDQSIIIQNLQFVAQKIGGLALVSHHVGKDGGASGARGSSVWTPSVDVEIFMDYADGAGTMKILKQKEGPRDVVYYFKQKIITLGILKKTGKPYGSVVIEHTDDAPKTVRGKKLPTLGTNNAIALKAVKALLVENGGPVHSDDARAAIKAALTAPEPGEKDRRSSRAAQYIDALVNLGHLHRIDQTINDKEKSNVVEGKWDDT